MSSHNVDSIYQDHHPDTENDLGELADNHVPQYFSAYSTLSNSKMDNIGSTLSTTIKGTILERIAPKRTFPGVIARLETVILTYWIYIAIVSIFLNIFAVYYVSEVKWTYHTYHTHRLYLAPHWIIHGVLVFVLMNDLVRSSSMSTREQQKVDYKVDRTTMIPKLITIGILGTLEFWTMRNEAEFFKGIISVPKPLYYILETINLRFIITPCYQDFRQRLHQGSSSSSSRPSRSSKLLEIALIIAMVWCTFNRIMFVGSIDMCSDCLSRISWTDVLLTGRNIVSFAVPFVYLVMKRVISYYHYSGEKNTLQKDSNRPNLSILTVLIVTSFLIGVPYPEFLFLNFLLMNAGHPFFFLTPIVILSCLISLYSYHGPRTGRNIVITALLLSFIFLIFFLLF